MYVTENYNKNNKPHINPWTELPHFCRSSIKHLPWGMSGSQVHKRQPWSTQDPRGQPWWCCHKIWLVWSVHNTTARNTKVNYRLSTLVIFRGGGWRNALRMRLSGKQISRGVNLLTREGEGGENSIMEIQDWSLPDFAIKLFINDCQEIEREVLKRKISTRHETGIPWQGHTLHFHLYSD